MLYAVLLKTHANVRYLQSIEKLALAELQCILQAWGMDAKPGIQEISEVSFLVFEVDAISDSAWTAISRHASIAFAASVEGELLRPLPLTRDDYLSGDIAEVLKYKGKTNADFTSTAFHCALSASDFARDAQPLTVLDPVCGKGTTLFCAVQEGHHAVGVDVDSKAITEADAYFARYLKYHKLKHRRTAGSLTLPKGNDVKNSAKEIRYFFANTPERYRAGDILTLRFVLGDTRAVDQMLGSKSCHIIVGDLPYGVQHAPRQGGKPVSIGKLLEEAMPAYERVLKPGGTIALSFNTYTLPKQAVAEAMRRVGFNVLEQAPYADFSHWVEQAVDRDLVIAKKEG